MHGGLFLADSHLVLVSIALSRHDFAEPIRTGQLRLLLAIDLAGIDVQDFEVVAHHPLLRQVYSRDLRLLEDGIGPRRALICEGGLFVGDVADALETMGFSVYIWDIHRLSSSALDGVVARFDPEVIFAINHTHGLAEACHRLGRPLVVWEVDPATDTLRRCDSPTDRVRIFTYRQAHVTRFQAAGFQEVQYLPLAANTARRTPGEVPADAAARGKLCFVGASMAEQAWRFRKAIEEAWILCGGEAEEGMARLDRILAAQRRLGGQYGIPALVQAAMGDFAQAAREILPHEVTAMIAEMAAAERRLNVVARLGRTGIHVWGDAGWRTTVAHGARYMGFAGHDKALTQIYRAGAVHVDVARIYQQDIVPMRIFDILACGGFVLAEHSAALDALFTPGKDLETWRTTEELEAKVQYYLAHPEQAAAIGRTGMATVRRSHSIAARVRFMLQSLDQGWSRRSVV